MTGMVPGYRALAGAVRALGSDPVFGLMGEANLAWVSCLTEELGGRFLSSRHEAGAICMAVGHQVATGRPSICTVTHGPGLMNGLTALKAAVDLGAAITVITADTPRDRPLHLQRADHRLLARAAGAHYVQPTDPDDLTSAVLDAAHSAGRNARPVLLNLPLEWLYEQREWRGPGPTPNGDAAPPPEARSECVADIVALLAEADRPLILAGRGAWRSGAEPVLPALSARFGAPVVTTLAARGLAAGVAVGAVGGYGADHANALAQSCDLVIALGASLNEYTTDGGRLFRGATVVQVDTDEAAFGRHGDRPGHAVLGDVAGVVRQLLATTPDRPAPSWAPEAAEPRPEPVPGPGVPSGVDPRAAMRVLDEELPAGRRVIVDGGHCAEWPSRYLSVSAPGRFLQSTGAGAIGHALGLGIGAALGDRDEPTVVVLGDGALMMSAPELDTAVRSRARLMIVVLDDAAYGAEVHRLHALGLPPGQATFQPVKAAALMAAVGGRAVRVTDLADLRSAARDWSGTGPLLLDVPVDPAIVSRRLQPITGVT
ncbi:thiamine pyrophosphate-binding protein [Luedemannella helvata]|uniref:Thiamine pyrophosphate-binding protein n=1 Tax=Luedemannella helvata TaxID=349315 RepID=A0ABN2JV97_9ACTN